MRNFFLCFSMLFCHVQSFLCLSIPLSSCNFLCLFLYVMFRCFSFSCLILLLFHVMFCFCFSLELFIFLLGFPLASLQFCGPCFYNVSCSASNLFSCFVLVFVLVVICFSIACVFCHVLLSCTCSFAQSGSCFGVLGVMSCFFLFCCISVCFPVTFSLAAIVLPLFSFVYLFVP